jgi:hypothetical protein
LEEITPASVVYLQHLRPVCKPLSINGVDIQILMPICCLKPDHSQQTKNYVPNSDGSIISDGRIITEFRWSIISDGINNITQSGRGSINYGDRFIQKVWHMNNSKSDQLPGDEECMTGRCGWRPLFVE